ncbi:MAG TPA: DMT family transporter [Desulfuromonadales bacterium]|nr:DMT family transporter [Desulfuromonadales bacterium]
MQRQTAVLMLVGAALFWSTGGFLIKWVDWHPLAISGMRSAIGAAVLFAVFRPRRFTWSWLQLGAAVAYAATVTLFVVANKATTAANAILLQYTAPVHVALFGAWFLGEKPRRLDWLTLLLVLGGMVLFFLEDLSATGMWGNLAALASGLSFAWLALFLRRQKEGSPVESILLGNLLAALIGLPFMLQSSPTEAGWLGLTLLGVFQVGLPYALFARAIREVTALEAMLIPAIEPVLNPLWVLLLLGEAPGGLALVGGAVILSAVTGRGLLPLLERRHRPWAAG